MTKFKTEFINKSGSTIKIPLFHDGLERITLDKGTEKEPFTGFIEQPKNCLFSGYSAVLYLPDGTVAGKKRKTFKRDKTDFPTVLQNDSSIQIQIYRHNKGTLHVPQGIDVYFQFDITDISCEYDRIRFTNPEDTGKTRWSISGMGSPLEIPITQDIWKVLRKPKELVKLKEERLKAVKLEQEKDLQAEEKRQLRKLRLREESGQ